MKWVSRIVQVPSRFNACFYGAAPKKANRAVPKYTKSLKEVENNQVINLYLGTGFCKVFDFRTLVMVCCTNCAKAIA